MSTNSTSDRYQFIFGSTVRELDTHHTDKNDYINRTKQPVHRNEVVSEEKRKEELTIRNNQRRFYAVNRRFAVLLLFSVIIVAISCAMYVNKSSQISSMARQVKQLKTEKASLLNKQAAIKSEIDKSLDLEEIRSYAESNLKMVDPTGSKVIYYKNVSDDYFRQYGNIESGE